jgi:predicted permease
VTETALAALVIILAGAAARRAGVLGPEDGPVIVRLVIYLFLPPLVFRIVAGADLEPALILVPLAGWVIHLILLGLSLGTTRGLRVERPRAGALAVASAVGNTGFFGLPLIAASGGGFSLPAAVMYDTFCTGLVTWTSTVAVARAYGEGGHRGRISLGPLATAFLLPPNWALAAGLVVNLAGAGDLPSVVERPCELLGDAVLPLVMIYAGVLLDVAGLGRLWRQVSVVAAVRLVLAALLGLGVGLAFRFAGATLHTVVLMAAMPTAMLSLVIGTEFRLRADLIAAAVVTTTVVSTLTLPTIRALLL